MDERIATGSTNLVALRLAVGAEVERITPLTPGAITRVSVTTARVRAVADGAEDAFAQAGRQTWLRCRRPCWWKAKDARNIMQLMTERSAGAIGQPRIRR